MGRFFEEVLIYLIAYGILFSIIFIFFLLVYIKNKILLKDKEKFEDERVVSEIFFLKENIDLNSNFAKRKVYEKWFFLLDIPFFKKIEFFINLKEVLKDEKNQVFFKIFSVFYFLSFFIIPFVLSIFLEVETNINISFFIFIFYLFVYFLYFLNNYEKVIAFFMFFWNNSLDKISWIKSNFIIIFENKVLVDNKNFPIKDWDFRTNQEFLEFFSKKEYLKYYDFKYFLKIDKIINFVNKKYRLVNNFHKKIKILDEKLTDLGKISKNLEKSIFENEEFFYKTSVILKNFKNLDLKVLDILKDKKFILENFSKITNEKDLDLSKFDLYVLNNIITPVFWLLNILKENLEKVEEVLLKLEELKNNQTEFSKKRLEIQRKNLQKHIFLLEEKVKFLKNLKKYVKI